MEPLKKLQAIRSAVGPRKTQGLPDDVIGRFLPRHKKLAQAIDAAYERHQGLMKDWGEILRKPEAEAIQVVQDGLVNFYPAAQTNPYIALAACGPWLVTAYGAVLHDSGGYGMLGFGHNPEKVRAAMTDNHVMANVMTPSFSHKRLVDRLRREIGHRRGTNPLSHFICVNSGSEAVSVALRISDVNARRLTDPGARHHGKKIAFLALQGGFHGRTDRPAQASSSTLRKYKEALATFRDRENLRTVQPNDVAWLKETFAKAEREGVFFEAFLMEPVMGEGDPGKAITPEFYAAARELTQKHGTLLIVDSIQAGLRAHGYLSICDYPGFENLPAPDIETYSKALNAGQYPLSVLAMRPEIAEFYVRGIYGNTMTTNPRALEVACAVLDSLTPELRKNIQERGAEMVAKFKGLQAEFPDLITHVQGTGLLLSCAINPEKFEVVGFGQLEEYLRVHGIGVIHGGPNSLRFTPHFEITSEEVDLVVDVLREALVNGPRKDRGVARPAAAELRA